MALIRATEIPRAIFNGMKTSARAIARASVLAAQVTRNTAVASYQLLGKHTFSLHDPALDVPPKDFKSLPTAAKVAFMVTPPLIPLSVLASITVVPFIAHTISSFARTGYKVANLPLFDVPEDQFNVTDLPGIENAVDPRTKGQKAYGSLGFLLGAVVGGVVALGVGVVRVITNSADTSSRLFNTMTNKLLAADDEYDKEKKSRFVTGDARHYARQFGLGFPGLIVGGIAGALGFAAVAIGRAITNSAKTATRLTKTMTNVVLHKDDEFNQAECFDGKDKNDPRHPGYIYVVGFPGLVVGAVAGLVGMASTVAARIVTNSCKTGLRAFNSVVNAALHKDESFASDYRFAAANDERHWFRKYVVGSPGILIGGVIGAGVALTAGLGRVVTNSFKSGVRLFNSAVNKTLHKDDEFMKDFRFDEADRADKKRHWVPKYVLGAPGLLVGALASVVGAAVTLTGRFISQTAKSYAALSGSYLNGAIEEHEFEGIGGDDRHEAAKAVGGLGYVAATATTGVAACGIFAARKVKYAVPFMLTVPATPLTTLCKITAKSVKHAINDVRFPKNEVDTGDMLLQRFKNLYGSLNGLGQFTPNKTIPLNSNGDKPFSSHVRKSFTADIDSKTERLLSGLLEAYRVYRVYRAKQDEINPHFVDSPEFQTVIDDCKAFYAPDCFVCTKDGLKEAQNDMDDVVKVGNFIGHYLKNGNSPSNDGKIPSDLYEHIEPSFKSLFWGGKKLPVIAAPNAANVAAGEAVPVAVLT